LQGPSTIQSLALGANLAYFFTRNKRLGISLGTDLTNYSATYTVIDPAIYTFKSNDGVNDYRRRITLQAGSFEKINYSLLNFPLLFTYRYRQENWRRIIRCPIGFWSLVQTSLLFSLILRHNSNISFEGFIKLTLQLRNLHTKIYFILHLHGMYGSLLIASMPSQNLPELIPYLVYWMKAGYDFASKKNYTGKDNIRRPALHST